MAWAMNWGQPYVRQAGLACLSRLRLDTRTALSRGACLSPGLCHRTPEPGAGRQAAALGDPGSLEDEWALFKLPGAQTDCLVCRPRWMATLQGGF